MCILRMFTGNLYGPMYYFTDIQHRKRSIVFLTSLFVFKYVNLQRKPPSNPSKSREASPALGSDTTPKFLHQQGRHCSLYQEKNAYISCQNLCSWDRSRLKLYLNYTRQHQDCIHVSHQSSERKQHIWFCKLPLPESCYLWEWRMGY